MSWTAIADTVSAVTLLAGVLLTLVAAIGLVRFPDVLSRMHAATKPQTLGMLLILVSLGFRLRDPAVLGMLITVALLQLLTAPVSAHMVSRAAYRRGFAPPETIAVDELAKAESEEVRTTGAGQG